METEYTNRKLKGCMCWRQRDNESIEIPEECATNLQSYLQAKELDQKTELITERGKNSSFPLSICRSQYPRQDIESRWVQNLRACQTENPTRKFDEFVWENIKGE